MKLKSVNEIQRTRTIGHNCQTRKKKSAGTRYGHVVAKRVVVSQMLRTGPGGRTVAALLATVRPPHPWRGRHRLVPLGYFDFLTSAMTRSLARRSAFLGSRSSPFRYRSQAGWPMTNCCRPNLCVRIAWLTCSWLRTTKAQSAIHGGRDAFHLFQSDEYGASWPGAPRTSL